MLCKRYVFLYFFEIFAKIERKFILTTTKMMLKRKNKCSGEANVAVPPVPDNSALKKYV